MEFRRFAHRAAGCALVILAVAPERTQAQKQGMTPALESVRKLLDKYNDPIVAVHDGFYSSVACISYPSGGGEGSMRYAAGAMGVHFLNMGNVGPKLDPSKPQVLIYEPQGDKLRLVAAEWFMPAELAGGKAPSILGQELGGPMEGHKPVMPDGLHHQTDQTTARHVAALQLARRARAIAFRRGVRGQSVAGPLCATLKARGRFVRSMVLLFAADVYDTTGRLVAREAVPIHTRVGPATVAHCRGVLHLTSKLACAARVQQVLMETLRARVSTTTEETAETRAAIRARLDLILEQLESPQPAWFQGSLFDRRAERQARANRLAVSELCAHIRRRRTAVDRLRDLHAEPRLVAAWTAGGE